MQRLLDIVALSSESHDCPLISLDDASSAEKFLHCDARFYSNSCSIEMLKLRCFSQFATSMNMCMSNSNAANI